MTDQNQWGKMVEECPYSLIAEPFEWVRWMRAEGYDRRMHGGVLHSMIVDALIAEATP